MKEKYRCGVADIKLQRCFFFHYFFLWVVEFSFFFFSFYFFFFLKKKDQIKPYIIFLFRYFLTENLVGNLFGKCGPLYPDWTGFINAKTWTTRFHIFFHFIPYSIHLNVRQYFINPGIGLVLIGAGGATAARLEPVDGAAIWQQCHLSFFFFSLFNQYLAGIIQLLDSSWLDWSGLRGMISRSGNAAGPSSFSLSPASLSTGWIVGFFFFLMFWKRKMIQVDWFDCTRRLNWTNLATLRPEWNSSYWHLYLTSGPLFSSTILLSIWCI